MARPKKEAVVAEVKEKLTKANGVILSDFRGLDVQELAELRRNLRGEDVEYKIFKNTLSKIAIESLGLNGLLEHLEGPTAMAFNYGENAVAAAKVLADFAKEHENLSLKAGYINGNIFNAKEIKAIAALPPREVLLSQLVGLMQAPMRNLAGVCQGLIRSLAAALNQIAEQGEKQSA